MNRIDRLSNIITQLSKGDGLSTPSLVTKFKTTKKIIQTDLKEYLIPLFSNGKIYYDYSSKTYKAKNNFLTKTLFSAEELAIISILKAKSKDKYSDKDLFKKTEILFHKFEEELSNRIYQKSAVEKIDTFKDEIIQIKNAIESKNIIKCFYSDKQREIYPLKILNLEGYWYLIIYEPKDNKIKTFHLNTIENIEVTNLEFTYSEDKIKSFDNAITAYYKPDNELTIQLFIDSTVARYFIRKPISSSQRIIKKYDDNSIEVELMITDLMEIIPTIQRYMPYIKVIEPNELKVKVRENIEVYLKDNE
ncbi:MAG: WYL domain-containing protein [Arcobacteraceae bacterium]|nr:WYL domain-containing protein [Arcobacteraceae bacterium]